MNNLNNNQPSPAVGLGLTGVLFVIFLVLKLTGNIDWSWWWVTAPIWIPISIAFVFTIALWSKLKS